MVNHVNSNLVVIHGHGALLIGHDLYMWVLLAGLDLILHGYGFYSLFGEHMAATNRLPPITWDSILADTTAQAYGQSSFSFLPPPNL